MASWRARLDRAHEAAARAVGVNADRWELVAHDQIVPNTIDGDHAGFLAWARADPEWALVVAECATKVCAKPAEAAAYILVEGLRERLEDDGLID